MFTLPTKREPQKQFYTPRSKARMRQRHVSQQFEGQPVGNAWEAGWRVAVVKRFVEGFLNAKDGIVGTIMKSVDDQCDRCRGSGTYDWRQCTMCGGTGRRDYIEVRFDGDV